MQCIHGAYSTIHIDQKLVKQQNSGMVKFAYSARYTIFSYKGKLLQWSKDNSNYQWPTKLEFRSLYGLKFFFHLTWNLKLKTGHLKKTTYIQDFFQTSSHGIIIIFIENKLKDRKIFFLILKLNQSTIRKIICKSINFGHNCKSLNF